MKVGRAKIALIAEAHVPANTGGIVDLTPSFKVEKSELKGAVLVVSAAGVPSSLAITIGGGPFLAGDKIVIALQSNQRSTQKWTRTYAHTVQAGATSLNAIAAAINAKIAADGIGDAPYTSSVAGPVVTVVAKTDDSRALTFTTFTTSSAGTVVGVLTSATISQGQPQDLIDAGIDPALINLAAYATVRIDFEASVPGNIANSIVGNAKEIVWYGTPANGAGLVTLINTP